MSNEANINRRKYNSFKASLEKASYEDIDELVVSITNHAIDIWNKADEIQNLIGHPDGQEMRNWAYRFLWHDNRKLEEISECADVMIEGIKGWDYGEGKDEQPSD